MRAAAFAERVATAPFVDPAREGWGAPDMALLAGGRTAPATMPTDVFGDLWPLISDLAEGAGSPVDYVAVSVLAVAASLIGAKRRVQPFASAPQWQEPCILWFAPVGDPSSNKSPAIDAATGPLRAIEAEFAEQHREAMRRHQAVLERAKAERASWQEQVKVATKEGSGTPSMPLAAELPDDPVRRRLVVQDATPEALAELLAGNPNGILHLRDELAGWLTSFDRYSPGGREFWLEAYGGRPLVIDRKGAKGPLLIGYNGVPVLGGIQPEKIADCLLSTADDGLVPRFLWAWPNPPVRYTRPRGVADVARLEAVYRRLMGLEGRLTLDGREQPAVMLLEPAAGDVFEQWVSDNNDAGREATGLFKGFLGKLRGTVLRLAMVSELMRWAAVGGPEPDTIGTNTLVAVLEWVEDYAKPTALRVFGDAAVPKVERNAAALARYIRKQRKLVVNGRDLQREPSLPTLKLAEDVTPALEALVEAEWLRPAPVRSGGTAGRARKDYQVNPAVFEVGGE